VSDEPSIVVVRSGAARGLRFPIWPRKEKYYWTGEHESLVQRELLAALSPGMNVWDIGAHIGFFTVIAARAVAPGGGVQSFEPLEANRRRLREALRLNGITNAVVHDFALAGAVGRAQLYAHKSTAQWTIVRQEEPGSSVDVPVTTLDDLVMTLSPPDVIKIDAEGAELEILRGGASLLERQRPLLIIEFNSTDLAEEARAVCPNYEFKRVSDGHWLLRPDEYSPEGSASR
jgi:FkbM family methyltransferase